MATGDRWDDEPEGAGQGRGRRGPRGGNPSVGRAAVKAPGTALLLFGLFSLLLGVLSLVVYVAAPHVIARPYHDWMMDMMKGVPQQQGQPAPVPPYEEFERQLVMQGGAGSAIATACSLVIILGAIKMRSATSRGLAMTGSILAMIPCTTSCCLLGLPIGIWAVVVLMNPDVKAAFADGARRGTAADPEADRWE